MTSPRIVSIPRERLQPWLANFVDRHGMATVHADADNVVLVGTDGARAEVAVPFPTLLDTSGLEPLVRHVMTDRRIGAILARKGGFAVGIFEGTSLVASKVGSSYVQGKTKAGGWSQQRYARRRDNQSTKAYAQAAGEVVRVLVPEQSSLDAVVTGGDKGAIAAVLADPRLEGLTPLVQPGVLPVVDPRLRVLEAFPAAFLAVRIGLNELA
ncbi:MAG: hypothetical protein AVDCRST_MAG75-914 [uncultured Propionibacteriaceae bacterium]|uniref:Actinobacteria/chloroflexi VLRF1 release factor domain-containing protein n=1 Tax=uncultured Propionibacteriaceae bacterium TaxID=257457 RepID=A0A6J4N816_9ACTN|nr:MAG: hypothetical protein AVDCRST_MAG75-914 [uncultured Propionibacteriaceae bacterium]